MFASLISQGGGTCLAPRDIKPASERLLIRTHVHRDAEAGAGPRGSDDLGGDVERFLSVQENDGRADPLVVPEPLQHRVELGDPARIVSRESNSIQALQIRTGTGHERLGDDPGEVVRVLRKICSRSGQRGVGLTRCGESSRGAAVPGIGGDDVLEIPRTCRDADIDRVGHGTVDASPGRHDPLVGDVRAVGSDAGNTLPVGDRDGRGDARAAHRPAKIAKQVQRDDLHGVGDGCNSTGRGDGEGRRTSGRAVHRDAFRRTGVAAEQECFLSDHRRLKRGESGHGSEILKTATLPKGFKLNDVVHADRLVGSRLVTRGVGDRGVPGSEGYGRLQVGGIDARDRLPVSRRRTDRTHLAGETIAERG